MTFNKLAARLERLKVAVEKSTSSGTKPVSMAVWFRLDELIADIMDFSCEAIDDGNEQLNDRIVSELEEPATDLQVECELSHEGK